MTEAQTISDIIVGPPAVGVGAHHAGVGVAALLPGAVDVAVAEGEVLVLVLGVVLGAGNAVGSRPQLSDGGSNSRGSNSGGSNNRSGSDRSNSRGSNVPNSGKEK